MILKTLNALPIYEYSVPALESELLHWGHEINNFGGKLTLPGLQNFEFSFQFPLQVYRSREDNFKHYMH